MDRILQVDDVSYTFQAGGRSVTPFEHLGFELGSGEIMAVRGDSGCGKTTLLLVCGGMRSPTQGNVKLSGDDLYAMSSSSRVSFRAKRLGYLFQTLELISYLNVLNNVKIASGATEDAARAWLDQLGLSDRLSHKPDALSHGERQRVALARALVHRPSMVVCDEPTGNLDQRNSELVFGALRQYADDGGAVMIASHDASVEGISDSVLALKGSGDAEWVRHVGGKSKPIATDRTGSVNTFLMLLIGSIVLMGALVFAALKIRPDAARPDETGNGVRVYCAAGIAKPVEEAIEIYNRKYDANVEIVRTGGSGELAGQIATEFESGVTEGADLYLSADDLLLTKAHQNGVIAERFPLAEQKPVIAVRADSGLKIESLRALVTQESIKFGVASDRAAVGKLVRAIAKREDLLEKLEARKTTDAENVMTLAQALATGSLDAAIIWDTTVSQINDVSTTDKIAIAADVDSTNRIKSNIAIGVLANTKVPSGALKFCRFLSGAKESQAAFERFGFQFLPGDVWEEVPEIHLYCGSMFTPVLEDSVREFAEREGVNIYPRWQGCGKLVASIEGTQDPDLYPDAFLACDISFLERVEDDFQPHVMLSSNDIVIAIRKEFRDQIRKPEDLLDDEIRLGICDPQLSALGALTKQMLSRPPFDGFYEQIQEKANVVVDVGPTLISQLTARGLDAAIVYRSNVLADPKAASQLELVDIESPLAKARQPWAIAKQTPNTQLMNRFYEWISREKIKLRFERFGFKETDHHSSSNRP